MAKLGPDNNFTEYIYILQSQNLVQDLGFFESKLGPRLRQNLVQDFFLLVFPQFYSVFWVCLKSQIVCRGAKILFWQFVRVSKKGFSKKNVHFLFLSFLCWKKKKGKYEKNGKGKFQEKPRKQCFWVVVKKHGLFCKIVIF